MTAPLDLTMTAEGRPAESFSYSATRGESARLDVTLIGDERGQAAPTVTVSAGGRTAVFHAQTTLYEWEAERQGEDWTTTLHATGRSGDQAETASASLPELVPWETQEARDALLEQQRAQQIAQVPVNQRAAARRDGRRMAVDAVVAAALATVPHRLLTAAPFPGYDLRADGGPTYSTAGKTAQQVVQDLWGMLGITAAWEDGLLTIRPPGPTGDVILDVPAESERIERIALDAPTIEVEGEAPAETENSSDEDSEDSTGEGPGEDSGGGAGEELGGSEVSPDPTDPDAPENSPDPDERDGNGAGGFAEGFSPTPGVGEVSARAVPLSWQVVQGAIQYIVERIEGHPSPFALPSRVGIVSGTRYTDDTVRPLTTYSYRLRANVTAYAGTSQNVIYQPSEWVLVTTPPFGVDAPPHPVTDLTGFARSSTAVGVKWTPPMADPPEQQPPRSGPADSYRVDARTTTADATLLRRVETAQTWAILAGLPTGSALVVSVYAVNEQGSSEPALLNVQLVNLPPAPGTTPTLTAEAQTITAEWDRISGARSVEVQYAVGILGRAEEALAWRTLPALPVPAVPQDGETSGQQVENMRTSVSGLEYATRYAVRTRGVNELGPGAWSAAAFEITDPRLPEPEPDRSMHTFETAQSATLTTSRRTEDSAEETTIWKSAGRVVGTQRRVSGNVALLDRKARADRPVPSVWLPLSLTTTRNYYEIPDWPLTLTASVSETVLYDRTPARAGSRAGREQERVHQEWSPQGWLNRRTTWRSKVAWVIGKENDDGDITQRDFGNQREVIFETWHPVGEGLWYYERSGTVTSLTPLYVAGGGDGEGEWDTIETATRPLPGEQSVSEQAPPQAVLPRKVRESEREREDPPPLPRNPTSPALERYPLDDPWFSVPKDPPAPKKEEGPEVKVPGGPPTSPDPGADAPPDRPPAGPDEPVPTPGGSGDPSGNPEPDSPPPRRGEREPVRIVYRPPGSEGEPVIPGTPAAINPAAPVLRAKIPWVRSAQALVGFAQVIAQQGGARLRITRTYMLPTPPPSLDEAISVSAAGSNGEFSMTVVTETR